MDHSELKLWIINLSVLTISFTELESALKLILLIISIGFSIDKWVKLHKKKKDDENN